MTGFGEAHGQQDGLLAAVEVRTINSRFFKLIVRTGETHASLEPRIEAIVRRSIRRGTVQVNVRVDRLSSPEDFQINGDVLDQYRRQLESLRQRWNSSEAVPVASLLMLPGVVNDASATRADTAADWPLVAGTLEQAMENLARMRVEEGRAMAANLKVNCRIVAASLEQVERRAPSVIDAYRSRLAERLQKVLADYEVAVDPSDLIKEVSVFADRGDISEEIVRLRSHLEQFDVIMDLPESAGRKLEFLTQEMFREANTIGSKANDVEITRHVIEIKTAVERIREMIQNVE